MHGWDWLWWLLASPLILLVLIGWLHDMDEAYGKPQRLAREVHEREMRLRLLQLDEEEKRIEARHESR
jgi:hypothetical protein